MGLRMRSDRKREGEEEGKTLIKMVWWSIRLANPGADPSESASDIWKNCSCDRREEPDKQTGWIDAGWKGSCAWIYRHPYAARIR